MSTLSALYGCYYFVHTLLNEIRRMKFKHITEGGAQPSVCLPKN